MFEYITFFLQVILVVAIVAYICRVLFSMGIAVYRDRLWVRLTEWECQVLEKKSNGLMETEFANGLLECTKKLREDFYVSEPRIFIPELIDMMTKSEDIPDDHVVIVSKIFTIEMLCLATKSIVALMAVLILHDIKNNHKNVTKTVSRYNNSSPTSGIARFTHALFNPIPVKSI